MEAAAVARLRDAESRYQRARTQLDRRDCGRPDGSLRTSYRLFAELASPLRYRVANEVAVCHYFAREYEAARALLRRVLAAIDGRGYTTVEARAHWLLALVDLVGGELLAALDSLALAIEGYEALGDPVPAGSLRSIQAQAMRVEGAYAESWRPRLEALRIYPGIARPDRLFTVLDEAAEASSLRGYRAAERLYRAALIDRLDGVAMPEVVVTALLRRAEARLRDGRRAEAGEDLARARALFGRLDEDLLMRRRVALELDLLAARLGVGADSREELATHTARIAEFSHPDGRAKDRQKLIRALRARAAWLRRSGEAEAAARDLDRALREGVARHRGLRDPVARARHLSELSAIFDEAIDLAYFQLRAPERALELSLARLGHSVAPQASGVADADAFRGSLRPDEAWAHLERIEGGLLIAWQGPRERLFRRVDLDVTELTRAVARRVDSRGDPAEAHPSAEPVAAVTGAFGELLSSEPSVERLTVSLSPEVPFLPSFLIAGAVGESLAVSFATGVESAAGAGVAGPAALLVSGPAAVREYPRLSPVRSRLDWTRIGGRFGEPVELAGEGATVGAFLAAAPRAALIHVATHTVIDPKDPRRPGLLLAPSAEKGAVLGSLDLASVSLAGCRLVALASCRSALSTDPGFVRLSQVASAFLERGAAAVLATTVLITDDEAEQFFDRFYRELAAVGDPATALARTRSALRAAGASEPVWRSWELFRTIEPRPSDGTALLESTS